MSRKKFPWLKEHFGDLPPAPSRDLDELVERLETLCSAPRPDREEVEPRAVTPNLFARA